MRNPKTPMVTHLHPCITKQRGGTILRATLFIGRVVRMQEQISQILKSGWMSLTRTKVIGSQNLSIIEMLYSLCTDRHLSTEVKVVKLCHAIVISI